MTGSDWTYADRYAEADRMLRTTNFNSSHIARTVGLDRRRVQEYAKKHGLRHAPPPVKKKRNGAAKQAERRDMRERSEAERAYMAKIEAKVVDLYVRHGVETPFLVERFGFASETICKFLRKAGVYQDPAKRPNKTGPLLANQ